MAVLMPCVFMRCGIKSCLWWACSTHGLCWRSSTLSGMNLQVWLCGAFEWMVSGIALCKSLWGGLCLMFWEPFAVSRFNRVIVSYSMETGPFAQLTHTCQHFPSTVVPPACNWPTCLIHEPVYMFLKHCDTQVNARLSHPIFCQRHYFTAVSAVISQLWEPWFHSGLGCCLHGDCTLTSWPPVSTDWPSFLPGSNEMLEG